MFESAEQYSSMAQDHVNEALYILTRYEHEVNGGDDEIVLDVGCGSGDVTVQVLGRMKRWKQIVRVVYQFEFHFKIDFSFRPRMYLGALRSHTETILYSVRTHGILYRRCRINTAQFDCHAIYGRVICQVATNPSFEKAILSLSLVDPSPQRRPSFVVDFVAIFVLVGSHVPRQVMTFAKRFVADWAPENMERNEIW
ncbi:unnamed protein product [Nesidiocoris tenuis]|uniref:Methyltransferase domain-containing protein n=1 Tax=Nesidiocoris tenuis TaxID=355587 RepID=A0A6H5GQP0_9HEMI|nr:unnamed protein product [Nesidiocoris tenuis]